MLNNLIEYCSELGLNEQQINTVVEFWHSDYVAGVQEKFYNDLTTMSKDEVMEKIIIPFNWSKVQGDMANRISDGHFTVMGVAGKTGYSYSIGLSVNRPKPHELVVLCSTAISQTVINEVADRYPDGIYPTEAISLNCGRVVVGDLKVPIRAKIVRLDNPHEVKDKLFRRIGELSGKEPDDLYCIYLGDKNNKLPGDAEYDESFIQTVDNCAKD